MGSTYVRMGDSDAGMGQVGVRMGHADVGVHRQRDRTHGQGGHQPEL